MGVVLGGSSLSQATPGFSCKRAHVQAVMMLGGAIPYKEGGDGIQAHARAIKECVLCRCSRWIKRPSIVIVLPDVPSRPTHPRS